MKRPMLLRTEVDQALEALKAAVAGLDEKEPAAVNKEILQNLYDSYAKMEQGDYTDESWQALQDALDAANAVLEKADATQAEVDEAYSVLKAAADGLQEVQTPGGDDEDIVVKQQLQNLYDTVKGSVRSSLHEQRAGRHSRPQETPHRRF